MLLEKNIIQENKNRKRILVSSPTFTGGSWVVVENLINRINKNKIVIGLGKARRIKKSKIINIPYLSYEHISPKIGSNIYGNLLFQIPLNILVLINYLYFRPKLIISNGFTPIILVVPIINIFHTNVLVYYGSYLSRVIKSPINDWLVKKLASRVSYCIVNSSGSMEDASAFFPKDKLIIIPHWTNMKAIKNKDRIILRKRNRTLDKFIISFVGRLIEDKSFDVFCEIIRQSRGILKDTIFQIIGTGPMEGIAKKIIQEDTRVKYFGFVNNRNKLKRHYSESDLTFAYADETYLAVPAIESLACGTPLLVSDRPAVKEKVHLSSIGSNLVNKKIGWIATSKNIKKIIETIKSIQKHNRSNLSMRQNCIKYTEHHFSSENLNQIIKIIDNYA